VFSSVTIGRWGSLLLAGAVFGLANVFLKPLLTFIALPLIILTFGVAYFFVNVAILAFTEWVVPDFSIDGFWTYVGAVIVMWLVNVMLGMLMTAIRGKESW
jgi:putative membrane protein